MLSIPTQSSDLEKGKCVRRRQEVHKSLVVVASGYRRTQSHEYKSMVEAK